MCTNVLIKKSIILKEKSNTGEVGQVSLLHLLRFCIIKGKVFNLFLILMSAGFGDRCRFHTGYCWGIDCQTINPLHLDSSSISIILEANVSIDNIESYSQAIRLPWVKTNIFIWTYGNSALLTCL